MPLDVRRLRDSRFAVIADAEAFRAGLLLWCAAWHQLPAGSLPNDDIELAQLAGYGRIVREWLKVKEGALYGWTLCSDGRLYHDVVVEKAREAWQSKLERFWRTECARIKKANQRNKTNDLLPTFEQWNAARQPFSVPRDRPLLSSETLDSVPGDDSGTGEACLLVVPRESASKGQGEGQGQGQGYLKKIPPNPPNGGNGALKRAGRKPRDIRALSAQAWDLAQPAIGRDHLRSQLAPEIHEAIRRIGGWARLGHNTPDVNAGLKSQFRDHYEQLLEQQTDADGKVSEAPDGKQRETVQTSAPEASSA